MRIAAIVHQFPPDFHTGTEVLCLTAMQALQRRGAETLVIAADPRLPRGVPTRRSEVSGVSTAFVPAAEPKRGSLLRELGDEFRREDLRAELLRQLAQFRPDVVHVHHVFRFGLDCLTAVAETYPAIYSATDFALPCRYAIAMLPDGTMCAGPQQDGRNCVAHYLTRPGAIGLPRPDRLRVFAEQACDRLACGGGAALREAATQLHRRRQQAALQFAAACLRILVNSPHLRASLLRLGIAEDKVMLAPHAVPAQPAQGPDFATVGNPLRIGYFGSLSPHKGPHLLLEAVRRLPAGADCRVILRGNLSGGEAYVRALHRLASSDPRIHIVPPVPIERFSEAVDEVDVVAIPSLWAENAPLVLLTAMQRARYLVISDVPGLTEPAHAVIHKSVVEAGDAAALAAALERLIREPAPVRLARSETPRMDAFSDYVATLESIYAQALASQPRGQRVGI